MRFETKILIIYLKKFSMRDRMYTLHRKCKITFLEKDQKVFYHIYIIRSSLAINLLFISGEIILIFYWE